MCQVQYAGTIGWGLRVCGYGLGSVLMVKIYGHAYGHVLGLVVQCLELGFSLQFIYCKQESANWLPALKPLQHFTSSCMWD